MAALAEAWKEIAVLEERLDRAMGEVFGTMMGVGCEEAGDGSGIEGETVCALIGLAGVLTGTVVLQASKAAAMRIAGCLTGVEPEAVDATVRDAIGEVGNMVAGAWKGYDPELASRCLLSTPTVIVGRKYELFSRKAAIRMERMYQFEEHLCSVTVSCQRGS
ncbi:MAG: chemotaxis protein CheX [Acidobacteriota bacterium]